MLVTQLYSTTRHSAVNTDGDLEVTLAYDGAIPTANTTQATVGSLTYIDDDNEEFLAGGSPTINHNWCERD